ncbi:MAG: BrnT family toxin [Deltaproteobacteria bacterium]|nr:BrnT family toxin [Deltaproteobacteria bacterium]
MGFSASLRILVVCHCYRRQDEIIRIFSARKAIKSEHADYTRRWRK